MSAFRFEAFADAGAAQAAFERLYPLGSPLKPAVQALADMGAHCSSLGGGIACRYLENEGGLARWCWHVALETGGGNAIQRVRVGLAIVAV